MTDGADPTRNPRVLRMIMSFIMRDMLVNDAAVPRPPGG